MNCPKCGAATIAKPERTIAEGLFTGKCLKHGPFSGRLNPAPLPERIALGAARRDEGIERSADAALTTWKDHVRRAIRHCVATYDFFTTDEVWDTLDEWAISRPREGRSIAHLIMAAEKAGLIVRTGENRNSHRPEAHRGPKAIYRSIR